MVDVSAIQGKVLTCLLAETWDNLVCGNGNGVDQDTSNGVIAKFICCSPHLLAPKQALRPAAICSKHWTSSFAAGLFVLILHCVLFEALKMNSYFTFPGTSGRFPLVYYDTLVLCLPLIWPRMHSSKMLIPSDNKGFRQRGLLDFIIHFIIRHSITSSTHIL